MAERAERAERRRRRRRRRAVLVAVIVTGAVVTGIALVLTLTGSQDSAPPRAAVASHRTTTSTTTTTLPPTTTTTVDPATLPQTTDEPPATSPELDAGAQALWQAIVAGDPAPALPFFFPLGAYIQVKDIQDPPSDWQQRLVAAYERDISDAHATLGSGAASATFDGISVPDAAQWVDPGQEYNKIGYWRVYGARLSYTADGRAGFFTLASMISWRGQWYVVHFARIE